LLEFFLQTQPQPQQEGWVPCPQLGSTHSGFEMLDYKEMLTKRAQFKDLMTRNLLVNPLPPLIFL
jgi:hypothetical protein